jgi:hypothetical protein
MVQEGKEKVTSIENHRCSSSIKMDDVEERAEGLQTCAKGTCL